MTKHTPGPWQCYADLPSVEPNWHIVTNASRMRVLANVHIEPGNEIDLANARLITAAPELLAILHNLLAEVMQSDIGLQATSPLAREHAANIIAKVEGRT